MSDAGRRTELVRKRYNRIAPVYDVMHGFAERWFSGWRRLLWSRVAGKNILEIGTGTGKNFPYYPADASVTAIDLSDKMLSRARAKAGKLGTRVTFLQMDAQDLKFPDNTFDTVVASFVFCSVPDPVRGLGEVLRVCRPGGKVVLLEHVLSTNRVLAFLMNRANPFVFGMTGSNINRRTVDNVVRSGLVVERVTDLGGGIVKLIEARKKD